MIINEIWEIILQDRTAFKLLSAWSKELHLQEISDLLSQGELVVAEKELDISYISFIETQIALSPRGAEWNEILKKRLSCLKPYVGHKIITATFMHGSHVLLIKIHGIDKNVISVEEE